MSKTELQHREEIVRVGRLMFEKGWIAANDGNISLRLPPAESGEGRLLATPTGVSKGMLSPDDLIVTDMAGRKISGHRERTSEMEMHLTIYRNRPDVTAVVHAHPPTATGFAVAGRALNVAILPEVIVCLGAIPLAEYGEPGTNALSDAMLPYIPKFDALLLANHGAVAYADDLFRAYHRLETVEHSARIMLVAEMLGGPRVLPRAEIKKLFAARERYGVKSNNHYEAGWPLAAEDVLAGADHADEKFELTRRQLLAIIEEALKVRA
ncbi:MAG: class II aldolase/adducin family protein [Acidobacteriota bacterium]